MQISVAMATFNGGRYLQEQLDSIRRQTLPPAQVIICDDGSADDTVVIARRFAIGAPFEVIVDAHGQRLGFTQNFVRAIGHCTSKIIALCDQDDVWDEQKLAVTLPAFEDESVATVTHRVHVVDETLRPTNLIVPEGSYFGKYSLFSIDPWFSPNGMQMLFRRSCITPWLAQPAPLSAYGFGTAPFDEWIFYLGTLTGKAVLLPDVLGVWRRHQSAMTRDVEHIEKESSASHNLRLALQPGGESYAFRAEVTAARANTAATPPRSADGAPVATVAGAIEFYREMTLMFRRRKVLHDPGVSRWQRLSSFADMVRQRDYRARDRGGLGFKAILKDGFTTVLGPRR